MFNFIKESQPQYPTRDGNEIIAKRLAQEVQDPLARVRAEHQDLFPKTPQGEQFARATERSRKDRPPQKQTPTWKFLILAALAGAAGDKMTQPSEHEFQAPAQGFPITEQHIPVGSGALTPAPEDVDAIPALIARQAVAEETQRIFKIFMSNYQEALKQNKKVFEFFSSADVQSQAEEFYAFFDALQKNDIDVTNKEAVVAAVRNARVLKDVFTPEHFPKTPPENLKMAPATYLEMLTGKAL